MASIANQLLVNIVNCDGSTQLPFVNIGDHLHCFTTNIPASHYQVSDHKACQFPGIGTAATHGRLKREGGTSMKPCVFAHYRPPQVLARGLWRGWWWAVGWSGVQGREQINYQGDAKDRSTLQGNGERNAHIPVSHLLSNSQRAPFNIINPMAPAGMSPLSPPFHLNSRVTRLPSHWPLPRLSSGLKVSQ